jgi:hypothetical protein
MYVNIRITSPLRPLDYRLSTEDVLDRLELRCLKARCRGEISARVAGKEAFFYGRRILNEHSASQRWTAPILCRPTASNVETYQAHQFDAVTFGDDAVMQFEVETHFAISDGVLEVNVAEVAAQLHVHVSECEVVGANEADGSAAEQRADYALGSN